MGVPARSPFKRGCPPFLLAQGWAQGVPGALPGSPRLGRAGLSAPVPAPNRIGLRWAPARAGRQGEAPSSSSSSSSFSSSSQLPPPEPPRRIPGRPHPEHPRFFREVLKIGGFRLAPPPGFGHFWPLWGSLNPLCAPPPGLGINLGTPSLQDRGDLGTPCALPGVGGSVPPLPPWSPAHPGIVSSNAWRCWGGIPFSRLAGAVGESGFWECHAPLNWPAGMGEHLGTETSFPTIPGD